MSAVKCNLEDILTSMNYGERVRYLMYVCGYSSADAEDYALLYESNQ